MAGLRCRCPVTSGTSKRPVASHRGSWVPPTRVAAQTQSPFGSFGARAFGPRFIFGVPAATAWTPKRTLAASAATGPASDPSPETNATALVWFKYDLRTDDHPGMVWAAGASKAIIPFFCFDPSQYTQVLRSPGGATVLWEALQGLDQVLREQGSQLVVAVGSWESEVPRAARQFGATVVVTEEEVEYRPRSSCRQVQAALESAGCATEAWTLSLFDPKSYEENFRKFAAKMGAALEPLSCPRLPPLPSGQEGPAAAMALGSGGAALTEESVREAAAMVQEALLPHKRSLDDDEWVHETAVAVAKGQGASLASLEEYLRYAEDDVRSALHSAIETVESPSGPGGSFRAVFSHALMLGTLSRRRVYRTAIERSQVVQGGRQSSLARVLAALNATPTTESVSKAAAECAVTSDFHWQLAQSSAREDTPTGLEPRYWRWRGMLTHYVAACPSEAGSDAADAPALLLVHGFGAFGEHWRGNVQQLADAGYRVFAPTYPGYGRSEKTMTAYSQNIWTDFLRDFVLEIVGEKVVVAGNSIGGFLSASIAADHPELVAGLVLLNSAGRIVPGYVLPPEAPKPGKTPFWVADTVSKLLISYLESSIGSTLESLYPRNPKAADKYLADEIYRAACDPGAVGVFRSVFYLPAPRPLNFLIDTFGGPTMVLQGKLDPLNDAVGRAKQLKEACRNDVSLTLLDAGHCPHDEVPEEVNRHLEEFASGLSRDALPKAVRVAAQP
mmetsp:Transcript_28751/g.80959  ORF Transcript_28751/g.80959 Transcript_28751/m.80959 type:complete len:730 (-) Transcript_28751:443-2632(-)